MTINKKPELPAHFFELSTYEGLIYPMQVGKRSLDSRGIIALKLRCGLIDGGYHTYKSIGAIVCNAIKGREDIPICAERARVLVNRTAKQINQHINYNV